MNEQQPDKYFSIHQNSSIYGLLKKRAQDPALIALLALGGVSLTYDQLLKLVENTAIQLNMLGLGRNDRVAIALPNGLEMATIFLAVASIATCAPLNPGYRAAEFEFYLQDLQAKALIIQPGVAEEARSVAQKLNIPVIEINTAPESETEILTLASGQATSVANPGFAQQDDIALILHTSGTTSRPKIVPLTHANLCASADNVRVALDLNY